MKLGILLALVYGKTVPEIRALEFDTKLGELKMLVLYGRVIGLVHPNAEGIWYRAAANELGYRVVEGAWGPSLVNDVAELID
jgi:hypothetical protein